MDQCQSLKFLTLVRMALDEDHLSVLGAYSRPDLEIELIRCKITGAAAALLAQVLGRNEGPTRLDACDIDYFVLADGLRGNSRLKALTASVFDNRDNRDVANRDNRDVANRQFLAIAGALRENSGLIELKFRHDHSMSDETWGAICDSLKTHPTLEILKLRSGTAPNVITSRMQALVDLFGMNMSIHTIHLHDRYIQHKLFRESVIPYLATNRLRSRLRAIQKTCPIAYRDKVLGRALLSARTNANSFWMLLSGSAEVVFPSRVTTVAVAANLPTPATDVATSTSTEIDATVAASTMFTLAPTATGSLSTTAAAAAAAATSAATLSAALDAFAFAPTVAAAAANVSAPSADRRRKIRP
jgi:hypothetical protein